MSKDVVLTLPEADAKTLAVLLLGILKLWPDLAAKQTISEISEVLEAALYPKGE